MSHAINAQLTQKVGQQVAQGGTELYQGSCTGSKQKVVLAFNHFGNPPVTFTAGPAAVRVTRQSTDRFTGIPEGKTINRQVAIENK